MKSNRNKKKYKQASFWLISKFNMKILLKNPVNGGTPAIEKIDMVSKNKALEFKLKPEKALNVLFVLMNMLDIIQKSNINVMLQINMYEYRQTIEAEKSL